MSDERDRWTQGEAVGPERAERRSDENAEERGRESAAGPTREAALEHALLELVREQRRSRRWKIFFRIFFWLFFLLAAAGVAFALMSGDGEAPRANRVGVVEINGAITDQSPASADRVIRGLNRAFEGSGVAVVLDINSPGGTPVQAQRIYAEIQRLRALYDKPVYAVIQDIGASGAYYVAAAADEIHAAPASLVGSIGVIYSGFGLQEAIERLGIERRVLTAGDNKALLDPFQALEPEQRNHWQQLLDNTHQQFIDAVVAGRGTRLSDDPQLFSGLIWSGEEAQALGLTDGFKSVEDIARELTGSAETVDYTASGDPLEQLSRRLGRVAVEQLGLDLYSAETPLLLEGPR